MARRVNAWQHGVACGVVNNGNGVTVKSGDGGDGDGDVVWQCDGVEKNLRDKRRRV